MADHRTPLLPLLAILFFLPIGAFAWEPGVLPERPHAAMEKQVVDAINEFRSRSGKKPLEENPVLQQVATEWALYMAREGKMVHRPTLQPFIKKNRWRVANENIFMASPEATSTLIMERWLNSPPHRANLLRDDLRWIAVGISRSEAGAWYAVFNGSG